MKDLHHNLAFVRAISPVSVADNTAQASQIIDLQGFNSVEFAILAGALADSNATFAVLVEEGAAANLSDANAVADADLLGTEAGASFTFANDDTVTKIGYVGAKRYVRLTVTPSGNSSAALIAAVAVKGHAADGPIA